ncbi:AI-2E family transporter YdiK [Plesiomonas sp.]|uniref:AI-2E family transporter YdiK n=1 Tax=Plesiomonas sp. TaxID=2486279 RepID=UPI003F2C40E9
MSSESITPSEPTEQRKTVSLSKLTRADLAGTVLSVLFIGILIIATFWVVNPFLPALVWATMIVIATWPILLFFQKILWGKRGLATFVMTTALLLLFVIPILLAISTMVENAPALIAWSGKLSSLDIPVLDNLSKIPWVGPKLAETWIQIQASGGKALLSKLTPYIGKSLSWIASQAGNLGMLVVHFIITVVICGLLYSSGELAAKGVRRFTRRLAGERGDTAVILASQAIRAVALGVVVTALVQSGLAGVGLFIAGVPYAMVLTVLMFLLGIAQLGPALVLFPAVAWIYWSGDNTWGTFLLVWSLLVGSMDNFMRPMLIKRGADLPLMLILTGVIGGLLAFGIIGLFIGPVVLAVAYTLLVAWIKEGEQLQELPLESSVASAPLSDKEHS